MTPSQPRGERQQKFGRLKGGRCPLSRSAKPPKHAISFRGNSGRFSELLLTANRRIAAAGLGGPVGGLPPGLGAKGAVLPSLLQRAATIWARTGLRCHLVCDLSVSGQGLLERRRPARVARHVGHRRDAHLKVRTTLASSHEAPGPRGPAPHGEVVLDHDAKARAIGLVVGALGADELKRCHWRVLQTGLATWRKMDESTKILPPAHPPPGACFMLSSRTASAIRIVSTLSVLSVPWPEPE